MPGSGAVKAAGFSQRTPSFRYGSTPGTRSGRCVPRLLPPGMFVTVAPSTVDGVGPVDGHVNRHAAARVDDAADAPAAGQRAAERAAGRPASR